MARLRIAGASESAPVARVLAHAAWQGALGTAERFFADLAPRVADGTSAPPDRP